MGKDRDAYYFSSRLMQLVTLDPRLLITLACLDGNCADSLLVKGLIINNEIQRTPGGDVEIHTSIGFYDSSFNHTERAFCYFGNALAVCPQIRQFEAETEHQYTSGDHETIRIRSCELKKDEEKSDYISIHYDLIDDYSRSPESIHREIRSCGR